jgi:hypothetical protein
MFYCQRHFHGLGIPTAQVYAFNGSPGSEPMATEHIDGETLSDVWMDLSSEERQCLIEEGGSVLSVG